MLPNLDRYKKDLDDLIARGELLHIAMMRECSPGAIEHMVKEQFGDKAKSILEQLPSFAEVYQTWYSEVKVLVRQLLPDRSSDFARHYEKPRPRKDITCENYRIEDYLQGVRVTEGPLQELVVDRKAAIPRFKQQLAILKSVNSRFESSLFDIRQLVQVDLFDSELDVAKELAKNKFTRAAGALAGVVLERHLAQVCDNHNIKITKKDPGISDLNDILKRENVIDVPQWRFVQQLADIRNLCDHNKKAEPTTEQVDDLVSGVMKITKTLF